MNLLELLPFSPVKEMQRENPNYLIVKSYKISINFNHSKI